VLIENHVGKQLYSYLVVKKQALFATNTFPAYPEYAIITH